MLIGLGYKARSGKDTAADILVARYGFLKMAFADALKEACAKVFGFSQDQLYGDTKETLDPFWNETPRAVLQKVGTECFRNGYAKDVWVRAMLRRIEKAAKRGQRDIVLTDVRFPEEGGAILDWGGLVVRVDRPGAGAKGGVVGHSSETAMESWPGWSEILDNSGSLLDLAACVSALVDRHRVSSTGRKPGKQLDLFPAADGFPGAR